VARRRCKGVSIPQSGLQAFRRKHKRNGRIYISGFNPSIGLTSVPTKTNIIHDLSQERMFQSLNRAYKRSDRHTPWGCANLTNVSIPQSGLQAFRQGLAALLRFYPRQFQSLNRAYKRSDPQPRRRYQNPCQFQSLNRAYKRSDVVLI